MGRRKACLTILATLLMIVSLVAPTGAYLEGQREFRSGNLLYQDQFFLTAPVQQLFHSQSVAETDTETFAFSPVAGGGFALAQTSSSSTIAVDTGFFFSFSSFRRFESPTGEGYLHTSIDDPLVSRMPVFSGLIFPSMTRGGQNSADVPIYATGQNIAVNSPAKQATESMPVVNRTSSVTVSNLTTAGSLVKKAFSSNQIGEPDTSNILSVRASPTPVPAPVATTVPAGNITAQAAGASPTPSPLPVPVPMPSATAPKASTLLTRPMDRQDNKPFTGPLGPDYNPRTATRDEVRNISAWDRLTVNAIGRSAIDSTYMNRTSSPVYMNPTNAIRLANQFKVMRESMNMTHAGSYLQMRSWAL